MSRLVLFDLDGTLIDSRNDIASAANAARSHIGLPPLAPEVVQGYVGEGARNLIIRALGPEHQDAVDVALAAFFDHYSRHLVVETRVYAGVVELLEALPLAAVVLTNKPGRLARPICEQVAIARFFKTIWGDGDVPARKPDPQGALQLCALHGVSPEQALFVGDSKTDAATAKNAGIPFIGVTWGYGTEAQMRAAGGGRFVHDAQALARALLE